MILFSPGNLMPTFFATTPLGSIGWDGTLDVYLHDAEVDIEFPLDQGNSIIRILQMKSFFVRNQKLVNHIDAADILESFLIGELVKSRTPNLTNAIKFTLSEIGYRRKYDGYRLNRVNLAAIFKYILDRQEAINKINMDITNALMPDIPDMEL